MHKKLAAVREIGRKQLGAAMERVCKQLAAVGK
jgi:hypothetical protein